MLASFKASSAGFSGALGWDLGSEIYGRRWDVESGFRSLVYTVEESLGALGLEFWGWGRLRLNPIP